MGLSLAGGLVEQDGCGDGGVEAFDWTGAGDGDGSACQRGQIIGYTVALIADEERDRPGEIDLVGGHCAADRGGADFDAGLMQFEKTFGFSDVDKRQAEDTAGGSADGFGVPGADGAGETEDAICAEGLGGAEDAAEVAGVLESCEDEDERGGVVLGAEQMGPAPIRRLDERGDGLWSFSGEGGGENLPGHQEYVRFRRQTEVVEQVLRTLRGKHAIDAQTCAQGFMEQVGPFDAGQRVRVSSGLREGSAQLLDAFILLTLYNANRHLIELFASPRRFYAVLRLAGSQPPLNLHRRWCCDTFRLCGVCN